MGRFLGALSVKVPLKKVLGRATLNFEQLRTLMVEIESVINVSPITYVYDDTNSIPYPLTPSDLVYACAMIDLLLSAEDF